MRAVWQAGVGTGWIVDIIFLNKARIYLKLPIFSKNLELGSLVKVYVFSTPRTNILSTCLSPKLLIKFCRSRWNIR